MNPRHSLSAAALMVLWTGLSAAGCGEATNSSSGDELPYASELVAFDEGVGAGYGMEELPDVVLGPPEGAFYSNAAIEAHEVLSLGAGGEIILGFGDRKIVDGPGADFIVFENPFWVQNDPTNVWAELGEVSVSEDLETWHTFECDTEPSEPGRWPGCAGWRPTGLYLPADVVPLDPEVTGGDAFDLAKLGVESARYVRIRDLTEELDPETEYTNIGFDLDAVGVVHWR